MSLGTEKPGPLARPLAWRPGGLEAQVGSWRCQRALRPASGTSDVCRRKREDAAVPGRMTFSAVGASFGSSHGLAAFLPSLWGLGFDSKSWPNEVLTPTGCLLSLRVQRNFKGSEVVFCFILKT